MFRYLRRHPPAAASAASLLLLKQCSLHSPPPRRCRTRKIDGTEGIHKHRCDPRHAHGTHLSYYPSNRFVETAAPQLKAFFFCRDLSDRVKLAPFHHARDIQPSFIRMSQMSLLTFITGDSSARTRKMTTELSLTRGDIRII